MKKLLPLLFLLITNFTFSQSSNKLTTEDKLFGLSQFWQEVNYNFVYLYKIDATDWETEYKKSITEVLQTKSDYDYYRVLQRLCSFLKDGHTNVFMPDSMLKKLSAINFGNYRIVLSNIEGKAIITRVNLSKKDELPIGTEIINVNGQKTADYINTHVRPYFGTSPKYIEDNNAIRNLLYSPLGTQFNIAVKLPNGTLKKLELTRAESKESAMYPKRSNSVLLEFKWLDEGMAYVALNSFSDDAIFTQFKAILPELYQAKSMVIDLRKNTGGSSMTARNVLSYLTNDNILYSSKSSTRNHIATYKAWGYYLKPSDTITGKVEWGMSKAETKRYFNHFRNMGIHNFDHEGETISLDAKRIVVPTAILLGNRTASAAEDFIIYADNQEHMTTMGEPSYGSTGQPLFGKLPGGGGFRICTKKDTYPDGKEFVGVGIQPQIYVPSKLDHLLENKDAALETAIQYLNN